MTKSYLSNGPPLHECAKILVFLKLRAAVGAYVVQRVSAGTEVRVCVGMLTIDDIALWGSLCQFLYIPGAILVFLRQALYH